MRKIAPIIIISLLFSCQPPNQTTERPPSTEEITEKDPTKIYNFMNEELPSKILSQTVKDQYEENLSEAKTILEAKPDSLESIIWYGRRLAYLGRYPEAIRVYSNAITNFPNSYRLRRHRGHKYITTRQIDKAIEDFELAAYYSLNAENQIEPDGIPNKLDQPLSNDKFNIWYHFGLAYYLNGRFDKALSAYSKCMEFSDNSDLKVATTYWNYLTYRKLGNEELAKQLLGSIDSKMKIIENDAYLQLLLLFKGENEVDDLLRKATNSEGQLDPTNGYGIGCFYQHQGDFDSANEVFLQILEAPNWDAFGYLAAEAELTTIFPVP